MRKLISILIFVLLRISIVQAIALGDEYKKIYEEAEYYLINADYNRALELYLKMSAMTTPTSNVNFKIGYCYLNSSSHKTKSIPYLEDALKDISANYQEGDLKETHAPLSTLYYLAKAYQYNFEFDNAIAAYQDYLTQLGTGSKVKDEVDEVNHDIETCNNAKQLVKNKIDVTITNMGKNVNSPYDDYSEMISLDETILIFTSNRDGGTSDEMQANGKFYEDIYFSHYVNGAWNQASSIGYNVNTKGNEASLNLSADGNRLMIYKDDGGDGNIYMSTLKGMVWGVPVALNSEVNSSSWETHASMSSDGKVIYFVSDRPGGYGGRDIYKCMKLPNGEWGKAQNMGDVINTKYDEDGVFIHPDCKQIYFSSKGHNTMGGFDIFKTTITDENGFWSAPVNIGCPINTPDDDIFYVTTSDGKRAFISAVKEDGFGEKDIYMITYAENEPRDITLLIGTIVNNASGELPKNSIIIADAKTDEPLQTISANTATGKFGANLPVGRSYHVFYKVNGKEIYHESIDAPVRKGYQVVTREIPYTGKE